MSTPSQPGDPSLEERVARIIRVDHAGEYGAARIYAGQLAVLGRGTKGALLRHMAAQVEELGEAEPELRQTIETFRAEELEHRDIGLAHGAEDAPGYRLLYRAINAGCRVAIKLSERA